MASPVHRSAPLAIESTNLNEHPAALAWSLLDRGVLSRVEMWRRPTRTSPSVYRLILAAEGEAAVFAKRFPPALPTLERSVYEEILPRLSVAAPRYRGACVAEDGATWMFLEDVGDRLMVPDDPAHRALAARWLGALHASGAAVNAEVRLPDAGPARYLAHLKSGRDIIQRHVWNPWLAAEDRPLLTGMVELLEALEARWSRVEQACAGLPVTLVHGDFRPKNVRIVGASGSESFCPFDWEMAGWGIPAADLGAAFGAGPTVPFDVATYRDAVGPVWAELDEDALRRASITGRIFQALASTDWACASFVVESERHMIRPVTSLRLCRTQLSEAIADGAGWLEWA